LQPRARLDLREKDARGPPSAGRLFHSHLIAPVAGSLQANGSIDAVVFSSTAESEALAKVRHFDRREEAQMCTLELLIDLCPSALAVARRLTLTGHALVCVQAMGGVETLRAAVNDHKVLLAAHGPYTAAGATAVLGLEVNCVSQRFGSFVGVLEALEGAFERV
jgi:hypothetical protein